MVKQIILSKEEAAKIREINKLKNRLEQQKVSPGEVLVYVSLTLTFIIMVLEFVLYTKENMYIKYALLSLYPLTFLLFIVGIVLIAREGYIVLS
jgi:hypothetical protein